MIGRRVLNDLSLPSTNGDLATRTCKGQSANGSLASSNLTKSIKVHFVQEVTRGQVITIDAKTLLCGFKKANGKSAIYMISSWATATGIGLGQTVVDARIKKITAIPRLLEILELEASVVTIDAMRCQTEITRMIID